MNNVPPLECVGVHLQARSGRQFRIEWSTPDGTEQFRVLENTCGCTTPSFEFCLSGGAFLIRKTDGQRTWLSPRVRRFVAALWWRELLAGRAV